ncbi:MAG: cytosol nonspecific dipeptidase [Ignavibacteriae bacterium HGW-Ignavibacteriae-3]|nr:MAG: cytosol nonspecific dipeptidase [Ignavibacteriae bacterium HGW-Ignavibacteriae-3]
MSLSVIEGLTPSTVWKRFYEISQVPRPSKNEERIRLYLRNFAGQNNLRMKEDETGNIVIQVPPTPGYENSRTAVLQSHVDMVCEKNKNTEHDFMNDPIVLVRDGEWIKAAGTTLGADNGIGAAAALALVSEDDFEHGPLELLFTVDEETGLTGVNNLQKGFILGEVLLNLDTEEDGAFYVGCAGGMDSMGIYSIEYEKINEACIPFLISVSGLLGGHSGINIADGRANAIKLLARVLDRLSEFDPQIGFISGGSKRNAIPREAEAVVFLNPNYESKVREIINACSLESVLEYSNKEKNVKITIERTDNSSGKIDRVYKKSFQVQILNALLALPHGMIAMSHDIPDLVETSTNLATVVVEGNEIRIGTSQRSSIDSSKRNIARVVRAVFEMSNAQIKVGDGYPGWQPDLDSKALKLSKEVFKKLFSKEPVVKAVHAGLECGILGAKYPGLDMVSFGPTIEGAHSPDERVKIADVDKFYRLLKNILTEIAKS